MTEEKPKQENPDTLPATRGYVKCIARTINDHKHPQNVGMTVVISGVLALVGVFAWLFILLPKQREFITPEWMYWLVVVYTVIQINHAYSLMVMDSESTSYTCYDKSVSNRIQPWKPKKSECCEPEEDGSYSRY